ncbi:MAG: sodium:solute symporter [Bryobacteraceae bacterium]
MTVSTLDWIVLIAYLALTTIIGLLLGWRIRNTEHYFFGGRSFGKWLMIGQTFGVGTHAEMPVAVAGAVYTTGMSAIWFQWKNLFATPFYWLMAPLFRRVRRMTTAELVDDRYGPGITAIYNVFAVVYFTINMAGMLKGAGKVISEAVGGALPVNQIVIGMTVAFMLYSFVGGLIASAWTNLFQGILILVLSFLLVPLGWSVVGGMQGMKAALETFRFSLATPEGIGPWIILMLTINGVIGIMAMPHIPASVGTGKDERACRLGFFYGSLLKRICTIGWALVGLIVAAMLAQGKFGGPLPDPEQAFGFAARRLLFPGGIGLLVAGILAANMSTCSAFMVDSGALFTQGFYRKYIAPAKSDAHYLRAGRAGGLMITLLGVWYALFLIDKVLYSFLLTETMATYMGISIFGGIVWRGANRWGAVASLVAAMGANFALYHFRGERLDHWDANVFFVSLLAGILALVIVSLLTRSEPGPRLESFFARLDAPSDEDQSMDSALGGVEPSAGPKSAAAGRQLLLANVFHLRKGAYGHSLVRAYREDLAGLGMGFLLCAAMVLSAWLILRL